MYKRQVWKELEQALPYARVRLDCGTTSESIDRLLDEKMYPIVKVKRKSGAVHWIMLTGTEKDTLDTVSYTHLDVYKRQAIGSGRRAWSVSAPPVQGGSFRPG